MASASRSPPNDDGGSPPNCCRHSWRSSDRERRFKSSRSQSDRCRAGIGHSCCPMHAHIHPKSQSATAARRPISSFGLLDSRSEAPAARLGLERRNPVVVIGHVNPVHRFDAAPALPTARASALNEFRGSITRLWHLLLRFKTGVATTPARLASGWLARLYREGVEPSGSLQKVSDRSLILFFWIYPGSRKVSFDHLVGEREQRG